MKRSATSAASAAALAQQTLQKRVKLCDELLRVSGADASDELVDALLSDAADPATIHDALCRATVPSAWSAERDPAEHALALADAAGWQAVLREQRAAAREFNVFSYPAACPVCGVFGLYVYETQMRRADEAATSVRQCPNGHSGAFSDGLARSAAPD